MDDPRHNEEQFNDPAEMLARATFLGVLAALTAGILLTVAGLLAAELRLSAAGLLALGLAGAGRAWLQRRRELEPAEQALTAIAAQAPLVDETHGQQLLVLLEQWEAMEQKRGSPDFDPWALQVLRNDIRRLVESDPALSQLFTELQRAA